MRATLRLKSETAALASGRPGAESASCGVHVNMITHPAPKRASDLYTRLEMQWPAMCAAVEAIPASAWPAPLYLAQVQSAGTVNGSETKNPRSRTKLRGHRW